MHTIEKFSGKLSAIKDEIGNKFVPELEQLSAAIDSAIIILKGVDAHNMDIKKADFRSVVKSVNDKVANFKQAAKAIEKIKFGEIWADEADESLKVIKDAELAEEAAKAAAEAESQAAAEAEAQPEAESIEPAPEEPLA